MRVNNKLLSSLLLFSSITIVFYFLYFRANNQAKELQCCGKCVVGKVASFSRNSMHYNYMVNGIEYEGSNSERLTLDNEGELLPVVYLGNNVNISYMVDKQIQGYEYNDKIPDSLCVIIRQEVDMWKLGSK